MNVSVLTDLYKSKKINADSLLFLMFLGVFLGMPLGTSPPTICGVLAASIWILSGKAQKSIRYYLRQTWFWPVLLLMVLPWVGLIYTPDLTGLGLTYAKKTHYWIYCLALASIPFGIFSPEKFIQAFLLGLALNAFVALLQVVGVVPSMAGGYFGLGHGYRYSSLSAYLVLGILMVSFYFGVTRKKTTRFVQCLLVILYFFHLIILPGRSGYLTFGLLCPVILHNLFRKSNVLKISLAWALLVALMFLSPMVRDRVSLTVNDLKYHLNAEESVAWGKQYNVHQDRFYMWRGAIQVFLEYPIWGVGTGGYQTVLKETSDAPTIAHPHNNLLYMAVSYGVIGILAFLWIFWEVIRNAWQEKHTALGFFVLSTALVIFVSGIFNTHILDADTSFLFAVAIGLQQGFPKFASIPLQG